MILTYDLKICVKVTSANDSNVHHLVDAVFGSGGLTSCDEQMAYEASLDQLRQNHLPHVPKKLQQYFKADVEPRLRQNIEVGCTGWTNNACESVNHVLKKQTQWHINQLPELIEKCHSLVDAQYKEADRVLLA